MQLKSWNIGLKKSENRVENLGLPTRNSEYLSINMNSLAKCHQMSNKSKILEYRVQNIGSSARNLKYRSINRVSLENPRFSTDILSFSIENLGISAIFLESRFIVQNACH